MMNISRFLKVLASFIAFALLVMSICNKSDQIEPFFVFIGVFDDMHSLKIHWNQPPSHPYSYRRIGEESVSKNVLNMMNPLIISDSKIPKRYHLQEDDTNPSSPPSKGKKKSGKTRSKVDLVTWILLAVAVSLLLLIILYYKIKSCRSMKNKDTVRETSSNSMKISSGRIMDSFKEEEKQTELVFFVEEHERFGLKEILQSGTALNNHNHNHNHNRSSINKIQLSYNSIFVVKRLTDLQGSFEEFGQTMKKIGNLKHHNLLPLIGYYSINDEKHLIYRYQPNGSLLTLFDEYIKGKRAFPWELRLSIAVGIARGLDFIYHTFDQRDIIPHGNIKLSNILLNENEEPLLSEYGYSKFTRKQTSPRPPPSPPLPPPSSPEKGISEQADAFSFGVILIELLTGKIATTVGLDLVDWVKLKVGGEWTDEIFDKEVKKVEVYGFPLLNIALKCVSTLPQDRPSMSEVLEKIEEVVDAQSEISQCQ